MSTKYCLNPNTIIKQYETIFAQIIDKVETESSKQKLSKCFTEFTECVRSTFITYYKGKMKIKPKYSIENAAILNKMIQPAVKKLDKVMKITSLEISKAIKKEGLSHSHKGGNGDTYIFVGNMNSTFINIFPEKYKFSFEKSWKWWHWLLLLPILDFLIDIVMGILQIIAICFGSFYCAISLVRILAILAKALAGGSEGEGENKIEQMQTKEYLDLFPILLAIDMAACGKSVKEVIAFLSKFTNPSVTISTLLSLVASNICKPSKKIIETNMKKFNSDFEGYRYSGSNILILKFISLMKVPKEQQIQSQQLQQPQLTLTQKQLDIFKKNMTQAIRKVVIA